MSNRYCSSGWITTCNFLLGQIYGLFLNCKLYCTNFFLSGEFAFTFLLIVLRERGIKIALLTWGGREGGGF